MNREITLSGIFLWVSIALWMGFSCAPRASEPEVLGSIAPFSLIERSGRTVGLDDLRGRIWIANFIFTRCQGPCPLLSAHMADLQKHFAENQDIRLVSFSVDPLFDTPAVLRDYAARFGADPDRWWFLTGDPREVYAVIEGSFRLPVGEVSGKGGKEAGILAHTTRFAIVDRQGRLRSVVDSRSPSFTKEIDDVIAAIEAAG